MSVKSGRGRLALVWNLSLLVVVLAACGVDANGSTGIVSSPASTTSPGPGVALAAVTPVESPAVTLPATVRPPDTPSPAPTATDEPTPSAAMTFPEEPSVASEGLPCPATDPEKPEYARYVLSPEPWPAPDTSVPGPLRLADPMPGAGRNVGYPYGSDGSGRYLLHNGLDMAHEDDEPALAAADGVVIVARDDLDEMFGWRCDWYGQVVVIKLDELLDDRPVYLLYGHVKDVLVSEGQRVTQGEPIARAGTAGVAVVPHLHFEVRVGENVFGATRNPLLWIEPWPGSGVVAGRLIDPDGRAWQGVTVTLIDNSGQQPFLNTWTYLDDPQHLIRPDASLAENFVFGPVAAGSYDVHTRIQGVDYRQRIEVFDGDVTTVEIVTEPYQEETPTASP